MGQEFLEIRSGDMRLRVGGSLSLNITTTELGLATITVGVHPDILAAYGNQEANFVVDENLDVAFRVGDATADELDESEIAELDARFPERPQRHHRPPYYRRPVMPNELDQPGRPRARSRKPEVVPAPDTAPVIPPGMTQEDYAAYLQAGAVALRELVHGWELNLGKLGWAQPDRPALLRAFHQLYSDQIQAYILQSGNLPVAVMNVLNPEAEGEEGPREWRVAQVANSMVQVGSNQGLWPGLTHHLRYPKSMYAVIQQVTNLNRDQMTRANMRSDTICAVCLKESPDATGWLLCRARHESIPAGDLAKHLLFRVCGECAASEQVFPYGLIEGERVPNDRIRGLPTDCYFAQVARVGISEGGFDATAVVAVPDDVS